MSVLMTLRMQGDATALEHLAATDPTAIPRIAEEGRQAGATFHRFYATDDEILVVDEWPDEESFHRFFAGQPEIPKLMAEAGVSAEPVITCWRKLELGDDIG